MIFHKIQEVVQFPVFEPCPVWPAGHVIVHSLIPLAVLKRTTMSPLIAFKSDCAQHKGKSTVYQIRDGGFFTPSYNALTAYSYRIQFSVFTCDLTMEKADKIWKELCSIAGKAKNPLLLMVPVCKSCQKGMKIKGKPLEDGKGYFVV